MEVQRAMQEGSAYLRNGQDIAQRSPVNPDTLYMWDNQAQAIETYLANTEEAASGDKGLADLRKQLREIKKQIELKVLEFELKQEGEEIPPEPSEEETLGELVAYAQDVKALLTELEKAPLASIEHVKALDEPRTQIDNFLVESEPFVGKNKTLDAIRTRARKLKAQLETKIADVIKAWRASDVDDGDD
jgi:transposase-like protein